MIVFQRRQKENQLAERFFLCQEFQYWMCNNCFVNANKRHRRQNVFILENILFLGLSLRKKKKSFLAVKVAFCMMYVAGCKQPHIGKQLHGKNLTIKFECGGILSKMCRE